METCLIEEMTPFGQGPKFGSPKIVPLTGFHCKLDLPKKGMPLYLIKTMERRAEMEFLDELLLRSNVGFDENQIFWSVANGQDIHFGHAWTVLKDDLQCWNRHLLEVHQIQLCQIFQLVPSKGFPSQLAIQTLVCVHSVSFDDPEIRTL